MFESVGGSFRDPSGRVYTVEQPDGRTRVLRVLDAPAFATHTSLMDQEFFRRGMEDGRIVRTSMPSPDLPETQEARDLGWAGIVEHETVPVISYPYEWTFSMLKDAALLQLDLFEAAMEAGWTLKDATPYNIQFVGSRPVFIDTASYVPRVSREPWLAYRQFVSMFLYPLMLKAYRGIPFHGPMRASLDGLSATEMNRYFSARDNIRPGVLSHVVFPAKVEASIASREKDRAEAKKRSSSHSDAMVIGLVQSMKRLVNRLASPIQHTEWSQYETAHSYEKDDDEAKRRFVEKCAEDSGAATAWDLGCNTGTYSHLCARHVEHVVSVDGDHDAVERLYLREKEEKGSQIVPLFMDLANMSPNHGFAGRERTSLEERAPPGLVVCLALIHHLRISANIPCDRFLDWLAERRCKVVIEFVDRTDEMVVKLLTNKKEQYADYTMETFVRQVSERFVVLDRITLKDGDREVFYLAPKP